MSILSNLTDAQIRDARKELDGKVLSRPQLLVTDGISMMYACDVDIGITSIAGYDQSPDLIPIVNGFAIGSVLHNVPIAKGNRDVVYAEVGSAVRLRRTASGRYEIVGFSKEMPGSYIRVPVNLDTLTIGPIEDIGITARVLTLGELALYGGGFGVIPLGAVAIFRGSTFIGIRT